jgi:PAS domain S-box-containing protein
MKRIRVLHVDNDPKSQLFKSLLEKTNPELSITLVSSPKNAIRRLTEEHFDCVVSEYELPEINGIQLSREVKQLTKVPFILYTSNKIDDIAEKALGSGVDDYIKKSSKQDPHLIGERIKAYTRSCMNRASPGQLDEINDELDLMKKVLDESTDSVILHRTNGEIVYSNKAAAELRCYNVEDLIGMNIAELVPTINGSKGDELIHEIQQKGGLTFESVNISKSGETRNFEVKSVPINYDDEMYILNISRDISERKDYERKLGLLHQHASELQIPETVQEVADATLKTVMESLGYAIGAFGIVEGDHLNFIKVRSLDNWTPFKLPLEGPGISVRCVKTGESQFIPDTRLDPNYVIGPNKNSPQLSEIDIPVFVDNEVKAVIHVSSTEENHFTSNDLRLLEVYADQVSLSLYRITQKDRIEELMKAQSQRILEGAMRVTSMVRHDLRSPLQSIRNATHVIRNSSERTGRMLEIIDSSVAYAAKILEDLRFIGEPGTPNKEEVNISQLLKERINLTVIPNRINVETEIPEHIKLQIDPTMMSRAIDNLLRNAVEAMPGEGTLTVKAHQEDDNLTLTVKDTGVGMSGEVLRRLYEPFHTTKSTGTGLGLYYTKRAIGAHNGTIKVKSKENIGTEFTVKIPLS